MDKQKITLSELESIKIEYMSLEKQFILQDYTFPTKPSSDGYYHINIKDDTKTSGYRQMKARDLDTLKDKVYNLEKGKEGKARKTFKDAFEIVEADKLKHVKNEGLKKSRQRTVDRDKSEYKRFFNGTDFENKYLDTITKKDVENVCLVNLERYDLTTKGYLSMKSIIRAVLELAYQENWIIDDLYKRVNFKQYKNMCVESASIKDRVHSDEDIARILDYIHEKQKVKPDYLPSYALELQLCIGLRRGEVPPVQWNDIQLIDECYQLFISKALLRDNTIVNRTKTNRDRYIPLTPNAIEIIERLRRIHTNYHINSEYLFPADTENGCITYDTVTDFYYRMLRNLGITTSRNCITRYTFVPTEYSYRVTQQGCQSSICC